MADDSRPDKSWNIERLESYALDRVAEIHGFGRKTITHSWLFGEALCLLRDLKKQDKTWVDWVKTQPFSLTTATNAIKLFERLTFDELQTFQGMTPTDLKAALDIIKAPAPKRRSQATQEQHKGTALKLVSGETGSNDQGAADQTDGDASEVAVRKVMTTDYSGKGRRVVEPQVGPTLTTSEVLGQALNLLIAAEKQGITSDCTEILNDLAAKVAALIQTLNP